MKFQECVSWPSLEEIVFIFSSTKCGSNSCFFCPWEHLSCFSGFIKCSKDAVPTNGITSCNKCFPGFAIPRAQTMVVKSPNEKKTKSRLGQSPASFIQIKMLSIVSTNSSVQMKPQFSLESMHSIHQKSSLMTAFNFALLSVVPEAKCLMVVLLEVECR